MDREERLAELFLEWQERRDGGDTIEPEEMIRSHPEFEDELRSHFAALSLVDRALAAQGPPPGTPREIGDFIILREIDRGGMGVVYEAQQKSMARRVALKVLTPSLTSAAGAVHRFRTEAHAAGRLHHTNIVPIYAMGQHAGLWYYAMELVHGRPLNKVLAELEATHLTERDFARHACGEHVSEVTARHLGTDTGARSFFLRVAELFAGVAEGLETAHLAEVIHRDIKPSNLLLDVDGALRIVDFGLARLEDEGTSMTITGDLLGTPVYMSPEQAMAKRIRVDHRTDIYSLGATLYEVVTLRPPFRGSSLHEICANIVTKDPPLPRRINPRVPRDLQTIVLKAIEKDRDQRYRSAGEMARDLRRFAEGNPIQARPVGPIGRAWRRVRRRKVHAAMIAAILVLTAGASFLAVRMARESAQRLELEYARLCSMAAEAVATSSESGLPWEADAHDARTLYGQAIALAPDRPEAYVERALTAGATLDARLGDIDKALARGLSRKTFHLARASLFNLCFRTTEAEAERRRAEELTERTPLDAYFEARLATRSGDFGTARALLTEAIGGSSRHDALRYLALRQRSDLRWHDEDPVGALEDLHRLRELGDDSLLLNIRIASTWRIAGNNAAADAIFERALRGVEQVDTEESWHALCGACWACNEYASHARAARSGLARHPSSAALLVECAVAASKEGLWNDQLDSCDRALRIAPRHHFAHEVRAGALEKLGRFEEAVAASDHAIETFPVCHRAHRNRGIVLIRLERFGEALAAADRALELDPTDHLAWVVRGQSLTALARLPEAREAFERAIQLDPKGSEGHNGLGIVLGRLGMLEESLEAAMRSVELAPDVARFRFNVGLGLKRLGKDREASEEYARAIALDPTYALAHYDRGFLLNKMGECDAALAAYESALRFGLQRADVWNDKGIALLNLGRLDEALSAYDRAIELDPGCDHAHNNRGNVLRRLGRPQDARLAFERAIELDPNVAAFHYNLATALAADLGQPEEALAVYGRALALDDGHSDAYFNRGIALDALGRHEESLADFENVLRIEPGNPGALTMRWSELISLGRFLDALQACEDDKEAWDPGDYHSRMACVRNNLGDYAAALAEAQQAVGAMPRNPYAHFVKGCALAGLGRHADALAALRQAAAISGGEAYIVTEIAWVLATAQEAGVRDTQRALAIAERITKDPAADSRAWVALGAARYYSGDYVAAAEALKKGLDLQTNEAWSIENLFLLAMAEARIERRREARELFDQATALMEAKRPGDSALDLLRDEAERSLGTSTGTAGD